MKIGVIGGGITGLTAGLDLAKKGHSIEVFEKESKLGGLVQSLAKKNWFWPLEGFFHHFFTSDDDFKQLISDIGLIDQLFYQSVKTSVFDSNQILPFDTPADFLKFPNLDLFSKIRMGSILFLIRFLPYFTFWEKLPADKLFPILFGKKGWQAIWQKLMVGKFGSSAGEVSASWLWARLKVRSKELGYIKGGTQKVFDRMHDLIGENSGRVHLNSEAILLEKHGEKINIVFKNGEPRLFDKIVLALPLPVSKNLIKNLVDKKTFNGLSGLKTIGALALILRLKKPLLKDNVYWLNILQEKAPFIALVEHTNFINKKYYNNEHIVYLGGYYSPNDLIFKKSEKEIWQQFLPFLKKINPNVEKNLIGLESFSSLLAQPIIPINYSKKRPPNTLLDGKIILASPNHIFPWDRGVNYSVKLGKQAASLV